MLCAVISLCGQRQELGKALNLVADMRGRGIMPNIHTYTALINTCIRSGDYTLALDVFKSSQVQHWGLKYCLSSAVGQCVCRTQMAPDSPESLHAR